MVTSCTGHVLDNQRATTRGDFSSGSHLVTLYFQPHPFLFAIDLLTGYYWQSEARSRLQFYFLLAVANAVVLIVWALYNKLRFKKQQHHAAYQYTPQEYAESLAIPDELYQQLQKSHRMSVHFTSQGQIKMVVSEKTLVRV